MDIRYDQLIRELENHRHTLCPLYCISGEELLLQIELVDRLRDLAKQSGFTERISLIMNAQSDWSIIDQSISNTSLFSEKKLIEIFIPTGKPGHSGSKALIQLTQKMASNKEVVVILTLPRLDKRSQSSTWAKALITQSISTTIYPITKEKLPQWIAKRLESQGQHLSPQGMANMIEKVEGNILAAHQEILKLNLLYPKGPIDLQDLEDCIQDVSRLNIFHLTDAFLEGDTPRCIKIIEQLKAEGEPLMGILFYLTKTVKELYALSMIQSRGEDPRKHIKNYRILPQKHRLYIDFIHHFSPIFLMGLLQHLLDTECIFKGLPITGRSQDAWQELIQLCLKVTRPCST